MQTISNISLGVFFLAVIFGTVVLTFGNDVIGGICIITALVSFSIHQFIFKRFVENNK